MQDLRRRLSAGAVGCLARAAGPTRMLRPADALAGGAAPGGGLRARPIGAKGTAGKVQPKPALDSVRTEGDALTTDNGGPLCSSARS